MASEETPTTAKARPVKRLPLGRSRNRLSFEKRLHLWLYLMGIPMLALAIALLYISHAYWTNIVIAIGGIILGWLLLCSLLVERIVRPLQTLSNVVAALREDDYSFRARGARRNDAMGDLALEVNALAAMMQSQRLGTMEALALVERVVESMQSPVIAFDRDSRLRLMNKAGEQAFSVKTKFALGKSAEKLQLEYLLAANDGDVVSLRRQSEHNARQQMDRWMVKRSFFRLEGARHTLLMLSDLSTALRDEERVAWERLIRVLGHEINNSLTPIKSIANSLRSRLAAKETGADFERGLAVIENRAESLNRFLQAYRQLMGVPAPKLASVSLAALMERVVHLETRLNVTLVSQVDVQIYVDADQVQQALINLVRNATEAAMTADTAHTEMPRVEIAWQSSGNEVVIQVRDNGAGLLNESNLFVPFYTTKPEGTGIGLVLVQQIAEAHRGSVRLTNRSDATGCVAELRLPLAELPAQ